MSERYFLSKDAQENLGIHNTSPMYPVHIGTEIAFDKGLHIKGSPTTEESGSLRFVEDKGFSFYDGSRWISPSVSQEIDPSIFYMSFNGTATDVFPNESMFGTSVGLYGTATSTDGGALPTLNQEFAIFGKNCLGFGPGSFLSCGTNSKLNLDSDNQYEIGFWIKADTGNENVYVLYKGNLGTTDAGSKSFLFTPTGHLQIIAPEYTSTPSLPAGIRDNSWHHVKIRSEFDSIQAYVDNQSIGNATVPDSTANSTHPFYIGNTSTAADSFYLDSIYMKNLPHQPTWFYRDKLLSEDERAGFPTGVSATDMLAKQSDITEVTTLGFDTTHNPLLLYKFNGDLTDEGTIAQNLAVQAGTAYYLPSHGRSQKALSFSSLRLNAAANAAWQLLGDMTLLAWVRVRSHLSTQTIIMPNGLISELEADNAPWSLRLVNGVPEYFAEFGAGTNIFHTLTGYKVPINNWMLLGYTRESAQVQFYLNGYALGPISVGLNAPTGGTTAQMYVGDIGDGSVYFDGDMAGIKLIGSVLTAAEILAEAQRCGVAI